MRRNERLRISLRMVKVVRTKMRLRAEREDLILTYLAQRVPTYGTSIFGWLGRQARTRRLYLHKFSCNSHCTKYHESMSSIYFLSNHIINYAICCIYVHQAKRLNTAGMRTIPARDCQAGMTFDDPLLGLVGFEVVVASGSISRE